MLHQHCVLFCSSDTGKESMTRLEFKQRLSIAIGAAKGDKIAKSCHSFTPVMMNKQCTRDACPLPRVYNTKTNTVPESLNSELQV